jgi:hypothetical protein
MVGSMGTVTSRTSHLDPDVRLSPHPAPDILSARLAHVLVIVAGFM